MRVARTASPWCRLLRPPRASYSSSSSSSSSSPSSSSSFSSTASSSTTVAPRPNDYGWNPATNPEPRGAPFLHQARVAWPAGAGALAPSSDVGPWLRATGQSLDDVAAQFSAQGFAVVRQVASPEELDVYRNMHDDMQSGALATPGRHDLGSHGGERADGRENVGQIMWPSDLVEGARDGPLHARAFGLSKALLGEDMAFDFDMLIFKDANTETETPWHQDEAYWPAGLTDKRALTMWTALDAATKANGSMWYIRGSHEGALLNHRPASKGAHILQTDSVTEDTPGAECVELEAGDAVLWHGRTAHYSRGNSTDTPRRTFIVNYRPESMVQFERDNGFDHLRLGWDGNK